MTEIADILDKAADVIERNGWAQHDWYKALYDETAEEIVPPEECPVCAAGGINLATDHVPDFDEPEGDLLDALAAFAEHVSPGYASRDPQDDLINVIGRWNDVPYRTADEVVRTLRECAAKHREPDA